MDRFITVSLANLFSRFRGRLPAEPGHQPLLQPAPVETSSAIIPIVGPIVAETILPAALIPMANGSAAQTANAMAALSDALDDFLPALPPGSPLPPPTVSLSSVNERGVGLGNRVGQDLRGSFGVATLKGVRLDAVARYQLWADTPGDVEAVSQTLIGQLLG